MLNFAQTKLIKSLSNAQKNFAVMKKGVIYRKEFFDIDNDSRAVLLILHSQTWIGRDDLPSGGGILQIDQTLFDAFNVNESIVEKAFKILEQQGFIKILDSDVIRIIPVWRN